MHLRQEFYSKGQATNVTNESYFLAKALHVRQLRLLYNMQSLKRWCDAEDALIIIVHRIQRITYSAECLPIPYTAIHVRKQLFSGDLFLSFFVSLSATLRENGWTDLHKIFREGVEWQWDDLITFWVNSGKRVGGSKVNLFVITGHSSEDWR